MSESGSGLVWRQAVTADATLLVAFAEGDLWDVRVYRFAWQRRLRMAWMNLLWRLKHRAEHEYYRQRSHQIEQVEQEWVQHDCPWCRLHQINEAPIYPGSLG